MWFFFFTNVKTWNANAYVFDQLYWVSQHLFIFSTFNHLPKIWLFLRRIHSSEFFPSWIKAVHHQYAKYVPLQCHAEGLISGQWVWEVDQELWLQPQNKQVFIFRQRVIMTWGRWRRSLGRPVVEQSDRMESCLHLSSDLTPWARSAEERVHTVIADRVLNEEKRKC